MSAPITDHQDLTTRAFLPDMRYIDVPGSAVRDWQHEVADGDTFRGLADWYTQDGDAHQDEIRRAPRQDAAQPTVLDPEELDMTDAEKADPRFRLDDSSGYWYAYGRIDQGHTAFATTPLVGHSPSASITAARFGLLWARSQAEFRDSYGRGGAFPGMETAWNDYVASAGRSVDRPDRNAS